jgi:hypothetical protein
MLLSNEQEVPVPAFSVYLLPSPKLAMTLCAAAGGVGMILEPAISHFATISQYPVLENAASDFLVFHFLLVNCLQLSKGHHFGSK